MIITFDELRGLKDRLPHGCLERIAQDLNVDPQTVRNYFGASHFHKGGFVDAHYEPGGPGGGYVELEDDRIYQAARQLLETN